VPKLKTHKGAAARFKITKNGKLMRMKRNRGHFRRRKAKRTLRQFSQILPGSPSDTLKIKRLLPHGSTK